MRLFIFVSIRLYRHVTTLKFPGLSNSHGLVDRLLVEIRGGGFALRGGSESAMASSRKLPFLSIENKICWIRGGENTVPGGEHTVRADGREKTVREESHQISQEQDKDNSVEPLFLVFYVVSHGTVGTDHGTHGTVDGSRSCSTVNWSGSSHSSSESDHSSSSSFHMNANYHSDNINRCVKNRGFDHQQHHQLQHHHPHHPHHKYGGSSDRNPRPSTADVYHLPTPIATLCLGTKFDFHTPTWVNVEIPPRAGPKTTEECERRSLISYPCSNSLPRIRLMMKRYCDEEDTVYEAVYSTDHGIDNLVDNLVDNLPSGGHLPTRNVDGNVHKKVDRRSIDDSTHYL